MSITQAQCQELIATALQKQAQEFNQAASKEITTAAAQAVLTAGAVDAVSTKLPEFWDYDVDRFFVYVECEFNLKKIKDDATKYGHLVKAPPRTVVARLGASVSVPGKQTYAGLKAELVKTYRRRLADRVRECMAITSLGEMTPRDLLLHMQTLLPEEENQKNDFFKVIWLGALPDSVRQHLKSHAATTLDDMAEAATDFMLDDKAFAPSRGAINHIDQYTPSDEAAQVNQLGRASSSSASKPGQPKKRTQICNNHAKFGPDTFRCGLPGKCMFQDQVRQKSGNDPAGRR